jgi:hypothetical protein
MFLHSFETWLFERLRYVPLEVLLRDRADRIGALARKS